jgi:hypothetical protein
MPKRRTAASFDASRLKVLAAGDPEAFVVHAIELLRSKDRLAREAALDALVERPQQSARPALRALYDDLDLDGPRRDQGAPQRQRIVRTLAALGDVRDADIAVRAASTFEQVLRDDISWALRARGLRLLAEVAPELFPYFAVEHLDDNAGIDGEPARTSFQLLAATGNFVPIYQWLRAHPAQPNAAFAFELLADAPGAIVERFATTALEAATAAGDEVLCIAIVDAVVQRELDGAYPALGSMMHARISDALYEYVAMLLASTNRVPLLAILEHELRRGRRPKTVEAALRVRPTPEQEAILRRWEDGE